MTPGPSHVTISRRAVLVGGALAALGCSSSSRSQTLRGTATFPQQVGSGPVANSRFVVLDLNRPNGQVVAEGASDGGGSWAVPEANGLNIAVIFLGTDNTQRVRVSGLTRPDQTGFSKTLVEQTDIACEAAVSAVTQGLIPGSRVDGDLIAQLEQAALARVALTNFLNPASVTAQALQLRRQVLGI
jgi:hypothetical protein